MHDDDRIGTLELVTDNIYMRVEREIEIERERERNTDYEYTYPPVGTYSIYLCTCPCGYIKHPLCISMYIIYVHCI